MYSRRSLTRIFAAGMLLSAVPALTLTRTSIAVSPRVRLILPVILKKNGNNIEAETLINTLSISKLTGTKNIAVGDVIYVHLSINQIPNNENNFSVTGAYAISQNRPYRSDNNTISLRGLVKERNGSDVLVQYMFETLPSSEPLQKLVSRRNIRGNIAIDVSHRAVGYAKLITIADKIYNLH